MEARPHFHSQHPMGLGYGDNCTLASQGLGGPPRAINGEVAEENPPLCCCQGLRVSSSEEVNRGLAAVELATTAGAGVR